MKFNRKRFTFEEAIERITPEIFEDTKKQLLQNYNYLWTVGMYELSPEEIKQWKIEDLKSWWLTQPEKDFIEWYCIDEKEREQIAIYWDWNPQDLIQKVFQECSPKELEELLSEYIERDDMLDATHARRMSQEKVKAELKDYMTYDEDLFCFSLFKD